MNLLRNIDELIDQRAKAREGKDFKTSDEIRSYLDLNLVFVFDAVWGQEIYYLTEKYFIKKPPDMPNRKFVENRIAADIRAEKHFLAWLMSVNESRKP